jgi:hypothetical protein
MSRPPRFRTFFRKLRLTSLRGGQRPAIIARARLLARLGVEPLEDRCLPAWTSIGPAPQLGRPVGEQRGGRFRPHQCPGHR